MRVDEFPWGRGISIWELRDGNAECRLHGRCAFDLSPACGCFPIEGALVVTLTGHRCGCGCGERPAKGRRFVHGHNFRKKAA